MSRIYKAHGADVADLEITATDPVPTDMLSLKAAQMLYAAQARIVADDLWASLPGGTLDWLLVELMQRRASLLRVPFPKESGC